MEKLIRVRLTETIVCDLSPHAGSADNHRSAPRGTPRHARCENAFNSPRWSDMLWVLERTFRVHIYLLRIIESNLTDRILLYDIIEGQRRVSITSRVAKVRLLYPMSEMHLRQFDGTRDVTRQPSRDTDARPGYDQSQRVDAGDQQENSYRVSPADGHRSTRDQVPAQYLGVIINSNLSFGGQNRQNRKGCNSPRQNHALIDFF
ncbi:hypothetical protein J6590_026572 [Homalodisca vitripennis]|nr:hypothetical protein J6590_026572 [Homalodisca vitripennis]